MWYILDKDNNPVPASSSEHSEWRTKNPEGRRVAETTLPNGVWVSTVFVGLDMGWGEGPPILFETMAFSKKGDWEDRYCDRYSTWAEAEIGHKLAVEIAAKSEEQVRDKDIPTAETK